MKILSRWLSDYKKKVQDRIAMEMRKEFEVVEKDGTLFLTHNGVAFDQIDRDTPAHEIAMKLNTARDTAQTYRML